MSSTAKPVDAKNEVRDALVESMTEAQLQKLVIDRARELSWLVHHCRPAMNKKGEWRTHIQGDAGFVDLVLARGGLVRYVELKAEKGTLSKGQRAWREALPTFAVWLPSDWYDGTIDRALS